MKRLDENEIAQSAEWLNGTNQLELNKKMLNHLNHFLNCRLQVLEVAEIVESGKQLKF